MSAAKLAFEDFHEGMVIELGRRRLGADEIKAFAVLYDPQPMHLDEEAGKASLLGGLSASGWHLCCVFMRMMCDAFVLDSTSQGAPGVDFVNWLKPVLAGDTLEGRIVVQGVRRSRSNPARGFVKCRGEMANQRGETVCVMEYSGMFGLRNPEADA